MTDQTPPVRPRLDRAPGERYRDGAPAPGSAGEWGAPGAPGAPATAEPPAASLTRAVGAAVATGMTGAALYAVVGSFDVGAGLIAIAGFVGWAVAVAFDWGLAGSRPGSRASRLTTVIAIADASIVLGLLLLWAWSRVEGGVLGPLEYVDQRFGLLLAVVQVLVAGGIAALRSR